MLTTLLLAAAASIGCTEGEWRLESERCARAIGIGPQWEHARDQVLAMARKAGVTTPLFVRLGVGHGRALAWSYPAHGGYGVAFDRSWVADAPRTSIRVVAAHEVCHAAEGHLERILGPIESGLTDALESDEHLAVAVCVIELVGSTLYDAFLENEYGWDEPARRKHHEVITKFRLRPRSRSR